MQEYKPIKVPEGLTPNKMEQKGFLLVWPQKKLHYNKELVGLKVWFLAHLFIYLLHVFNLLPTTSVYPLKPPKWFYRPPQRKQESSDYIIEPDWNDKL